MGQEFHQSGFYEHHYIYNEYNFKTGWLKKASKKNTQYDDGNFSVTDSTAFTFDDTYYYLTEKEETNSDGQVRKTEYSYAHQQYAPMGTLHMLSQPYKVTYKDGSDNILRIDWTLWDSFTTGGGSFWRPCGRWVGGPGLGTTDPSSCN